MKLTQLQYFQTICKYNNITRAANELHVSQPSLSNTIKELEEEFGISLFYRLSKGLSLTKEGEIFYEETTKLLEQAERLVSHMEIVRKENQSLKLGVPPMLASLIFPQLLHSYRSSFPNAKLQMFENGTIISKAMVLDGTLDAAIISCKDPLPATFDYCDLVALNIFFYTSTNNPIAVHSTINIEDTANIPLILLKEDSFLTNYLRQRYKALNLTPNIILQTNQIATIRKLVENNTAATFLFDNILETDKNIVKLSVQDFPTIQTKLIWKANRRLSSSTQNLIQLARINYKHLSSS